MDWMALKKTYIADSDLSARAQNLLALDRVLECAQYDNIPNPFTLEIAPNGEYVPLTSRRPSVRTNLCRVVVDDSVALLFSEGHWPAVRGAPQATLNALTALAKDIVLNETMVDAATKGSVGSVALLFRVFENEPDLVALKTAYLTPVYNPKNPRRLIKVVERYKVKRTELESDGYTGLAPDATWFWFQRIWDENAETWYFPLPTTSQDAPQIDTENSVQHNLGFVPVIWVRNLPGGNQPDGGCTFESAIDTVIETDYLLSQAGRALRYSADPKLVLKSGASNDELPAVKGGSANALIVASDGDAKLLEINGGAAEAVLNHVRELRAIALEVMHGNRMHADKVSAAASGRSIEMMMTGLIWLADKLRVSYGEGALLDFYKMVCLASTKVQGGLKIAGEVVRDLDATGLELRWPDWIAPDPQAILVNAQGLVTAVDGKVLSQKTAVARMAALVDVDDANEELTRIHDETAATPPPPLPVVPAGDAAAVKKDAKAGVTETAQTTA